MKLKWEHKAVTTPGEIESHNNMVETLWKWRHAGLVVETEGTESLPQLFDAPKRLLTCKCGNDDLHKFTLRSLGDSQVFSLNRYCSGGEIEASYSDTEYMPKEIAIDLGLAMQRGEWTDSSGTVHPKFVWKWLISCDKCKSYEFLWSDELDKFIDWN